MIGRTAAVTAALLAAISAAEAKDGFYLDAKGGASFLQNLDSSAVGLTGNADTKIGFVGSGAAGYAVDIPQTGGTFRGEIEVAYRENDADELDIGGFIFDIDGDITAKSILFNGFYDFDLGSGWRPYFGAGLGAAQVEMDFETNVAQIVDDEETVVAFQVSAGFGYQIVESVTISVGYRFFATDEIEFTDESGSRFETDYHAHTIEGGIRIVF